MRRNVFAEMWEARKKKDLEEKPDQFERYGKLLIQRLDKDNDLRIWSGRASRPYAHFTFKTPEARETYIAQQKESEDARDRRKAERRAKAEMERVTFKSQLKAGSILYSSWGYDQTNIDFYQVTELKGQYVMIRPIASRGTRSTGDMSRYVTACPGQFTGEAKRKRIGPGAITLKHWMFAWLWDGREKHETSYA